MRLIGGRESLIKVILEIQVRDNCLPVKFLKNFSTLKPPNLVLFIMRPSEGNEWFIGFRSLCGWNI